MQDKIFKDKIFEVIQKSLKSLKIFSLKIFRLYGSTCNEHMGACWDFSCVKQSLPVTSVSF